MPLSIYLDHAATTPLRPDVLESMLPFLTENYANPSSVYRPAQEARAALDGARDSVAASLGAFPRDVIFTSGGTEGDNAAIKGVALASQNRGRHIVTTSIEHHAVLHAVEELVQRFGFESSIVPVESNGIVNPARIRAAIRPDTVVISVMWANNEIGTLQPITEIGQIARERNVPFHVGAVQAAGSVDIDLSTMPVDLFSISAHKFYGPKGVGALVVRGGIPWWPLLVGGGQERNRRSGTENVAGIVGLSKALELSVSEQEATNYHIRELRDRLLSGLCDRIEGISVHGDLRVRLPNNLNVSIDGVHGESLLLALDLAGIMASSGSACTSGSTEPSHVLRALGLSNQRAGGSLRLTLGRQTTAEEVDCTLETLVTIVARLRRLSLAGA